MWPAWRDAVAAAHSLAASLATPAMRQGVGPEQTQTLGAVGWAHRLQPPVAQTRTGRATATCDGRATGPLIDWPWPAPAQQPDSAVYALRHPDAPPNMSASPAGWDGEPSLLAPLASRVT